MTSQGSAFHRVHRPRSGLVSLIISSADTPDQRAEKLTRIMGLPADDMLDTHRAVIADVLQAYQEIDREARGK